MRPFQGLIVWQKGHALTLDIYRETENFPRYEQYGLTSQVRRSAASIPANIAEGSARNGNREFRHFLSIALGSATELEYHLILCRDLGYLRADVHSALDAQLTEVKRMLVTFISRLGDTPARHDPTNS